MSGKRLALILALSCAVGLMGATKPRYGTFRVAGTGKYGGVVSGAQDGVTKIFTVGQTNSTFDSWDASAQVVNCSSTWAWDELASNYLLADFSDSTNAGDGSQPRYDDLARVGYGDCYQSRATAGNRKFPVPGQLSNKFTMLYLPIEAYIPHGATILSAELVISREGTQAMGGSAGLDSLWAVLDTLAADRHWIDGPNTGDNSAKFAGKRAASWMNQIQNMRSDDSTYVNRRAGYPAEADSFPWDPPISERRRPIDWGVRGLGYVVPAGFSNTADTSACYVIDVKRPVQYIAFGAQNSGFLLMYSSSNAARASYLRLALNPTHAWHRPFLKVTYSMDAYDGGPWDGKEVAFCFTTDDGLQPANDVYSGIFAARGLSYTVFVNQGRTENSGAADSLYADYDVLLGYWQAGMEIGSHGRIHNKPGLTNGLLGFSDTGDSLALVMAPSWIDSGLAAVSAEDAVTTAALLASPTCSKTIAAPQGGFTLNILAKAYALGYYGFRTAGGYGAASSTVRPTPGDTLGSMMGDGNVGNNWLRNVGLTSPRKQNNYAFRIGPHFQTGDAGIDELTMQGAGGTATTDSVAFKKCVRGLIDQAAANYNEYMCWFSHGQASNEYTTGTLNYTALIDGVQLRWALNAIAEAGNVNVMNFSEMALAFRAGMTRTDHPPTGTLAWRSQIRATGGYPFSGIATENYVAPAANDTAYTVVGTSPLTPRQITVENRVHAWPLGTFTADSTGIAWAQPNRAAADSAGYYVINTNDFTLDNGTAIPGAGILGGTAPMMRFPYTVPAGRSIVQALLVMYVEPTNFVTLQAGHGDTLFAFADTTTDNHALWYGSTGQSRWASYPSAGSPWTHRANTAYNHVFSTTDWSPTLESLNNSHKIGPFSAITSTSNPGTVSGYIGMDVTDLLVDHRVRSFRIMHWCDTLGVAMIGHPDAALRKTRPFLLVKTVPE